MADWVNNVKQIYREANDRTGGVLGILAKALQSFDKARATQAAAGMAYYTFFSLFPLLIGLIIGGSFILERQDVYQNVVDFFVEAFPTSQTLIEQNINQVLELRGAVGIIGLVSLLWSGTNVFAILAHNINQAWAQAESRNLLEKRLVALGMVGALAGLLILSLLSTALLDLLPRLEVPLWGPVDIYQTPVWTLVSGLLPWFFTFLLFFGLYLWVPNTEVDWFSAAWGALVAALGWEIAIRGFTWYLSSGMAQYRLVYGSLGAVVALLFWIYLSSLIVLFGAHLSAAVAEHRHEQGERESNTVAA
jgi:membrane protein